MTYWRNAKVEVFPKYRKRTVMIILDDIEKLIDEDGSTPILKERLGLNQDKAAKLEQKLKLLGEKSLAIQKEKEAIKMRLEAYLERFYES
jgi:hypothetical protein